MNEKQIAANKALEFIENEMILGLGSGSTVKYFIEGLSQKIKSGLRVKGVSTSSTTTNLASSLGIQLLDIQTVKKIDLTIDGADEVDENLNGIKGGGGALLYEKIVAKNSKRNIWIVDSSKLVEKLGKFPLPIEVIKFGADKLFNTFTKMNFNPKFRMNNNEKFITDGDHFIIDLDLKLIEDAQNFDQKLKQITGVVETGLFCGVADIVIVSESGGIKILEKKRDHTN